MDFLRKFETSIQAIGAGVLKAPQVIYVKDVNKTLFSMYGIPNGSWIAVQEIDGQLTLEPINALVFTALDAATISLTNYGDNTPNVLYSRDGITWTLWDYSAISIATGETLFMRGTNPLGFSSSDTVYSRFNMTGSVAVSGNIMALITGGATSSLVIPREYCFYSLFNSCTSLVSVNKSMLPATTLTASCYRVMFQGSGLTSIPSGFLPATTLATNCYRGMFQDCGSLTTVPADLLPATTLTDYCYRSMFYNCVSLTQAPLLPATTLVKQCYAYMFQNSTSLNYIKCLATDISASNCLSNWVNGVAATGIFERDVTNNSWTKGVNGIPTGWCANSSFGGLKFTAAADNSRVYMNVGGTWTPDVKYSLDGINWTIWDYTSISIPNGHWVYMKGDNANGFNQSDSNYRYFGMAGRIKASGSVMSLIDNGDGTLLTIPQTNYCFSYLFYGCGALLTVPELPATSIYTRCYNQMFRNCTRLTEIPYDLLPATSAAAGAYNSMFRGCTSLTNSCNINFTSISIWGVCQYMFTGCTALTELGSIAVTSFTASNNQFEQMFSGCTALTTIPSGLLQATTLSQGCYKSMFMNCTALANVPSNLLPATTGLSLYGYQQMFKGCTSLVTAPNLPALTLKKQCYEEMFSGCTSLTSVKCLATNISAENCLQNWLANITTTGNLYVNSTMTGATWNTPATWTVSAAA